jgi:hypothetical protein
VTPRERHDLFYMVGIVLVVLAVIAGAYLLS